MQIGAVFPQNELGGDPSAVRRIGRAVEDLGFDHLLAYDHVLGAVHANRTPQLTGPYTERDPFHDPFVMFAYLAGITQRLRFATGVLVLPQRQTALVARQAADVDLLSGGRLRLGVGVGWNPVEYEALGQDFRTRGARQEEQIELLRRLFTEPVVDFSGRFDRVDRAALVPKPAQPIPIWLGGSGPAAFDRAARSRTSAGTTWRFLRAVSMTSLPKSTPGARQVVPISQLSRWAAAWTPSTATSTT
jgi:probable F420-dependent oxidoreductase